MYSFTQRLNVCYFANLFYVLLQISDQEDSEEDDGSESLLLDAEEGEDKETRKNSLDSQNSQVEEESEAPVQNATDITTPVERKKSHFANVVPRSSAKKKRLDEKKLDKAFEILTSASEKSMFQVPLNEWQIFGNLVSTKIQKYPPYVQVAVQRDIMNILYEADLGNYDPPSSFVPQSYPPHASPHYTTSSSSSYPSAPHTPLPISSPQYRTCPPHPSPHYTTSSSSSNHSAPLPISYTQHTTLSTQQSLPLLSSSQPNQAIEVNERNVLLLDI